MTEATENEVPCLKGSPTLKAVIATPASAARKPYPNALERKTYAEDLRLLQVDFAVRDDRIPAGPEGIGWVFGTFIYDGTLEHREVSVVHRRSRQAFRPCQYLSYLTEPMFS